MYYGETPSKSIVRRFVWWQHQALLGKNFNKTPHVFLASRVAGDVGELRNLGIKPDDVWAVDADPQACRALYTRMDRECFRVFNKPVEILLENPPRTAHPIRSVFLDFCGTMDGRSKTTVDRVLKRLPVGSVVTITQMRGRERETIRNRDRYMRALVEASAAHPVSLVQTIAYQSSKRSPMGVWTFYLGSPVPFVTKVDISRYTKTQVTGLTTEGACRSFWQAASKTSSPHEAAVKANATRRRLRDAT